MSVIGSVIAGNSVLTGFELREMQSSTPLVIVCLAQASSAVDRMGFSASRSSTLVDVAGLTKAHKRGELRMD